MQAANARAGDEAVIVVDGNAGAVDGHPKAQLALPPTFGPCPTCEGRVCGDRATQPWVARLDDQAAQALQAHPLRRDGA